MENFSDRVRKQMNLLGLKAADVARALEIKNRQTVSSWINGKAKPHADDLVRLAKTLETSVDYLLSGNENPNFKIPAGKMLIETEEYIEYLKLKNEKLSKENSGLKSLVNMLLKNNQN